ncbi:hypothetical protein O6H91_23G048900 [Diphasiastrum complanatum]|uniref:Uncharacterized protein n=7 Tax=Diphasiastrum complanatum TaxID=34168 RepID=A0ACC2A8M5_DIPCM|nr:hypothetical protein O6H91_23G019600 [Diphasiastrum complanatum]KAJ7513912.1 hypothetical protein O6H91_23G019600 [Diphasiastrum complanatum]KAJ7513913.1 hypothetical protein O6H91_23G019600 [Diphasiastrum complanatum]KAJ7514540.1 hypothetical protein O6H91_23G048900 [Diphasiastrum complanatum]KAJ7514541.1 hypothetical protein O6H91_23G048900 [Diphasiastrum complanatum]
MTWHIAFQQSLASQSDSNPPLHSNAAKVEILGDLASNGNTSLETSSRNGEFLLQLLKGGSNNDQKVGGKDHVQEQQDGQASWQIHDPAVAAMGPSHPFPATSRVGGDISAHMHSRPPYMSHAFRMGWSHPFHPEATAFSSTEPFFHPLRDNSFPSAFPEGQAPMRYAVQSSQDSPPFPAPGDLSYPHKVEGYISSIPRHSDQVFRFQTPLSAATPFPFLPHPGQMDEHKIRKSEWQLLQDWKGSVDHPNSETKEGVVVTGLMGVAHEAQHGGLSHQQFYGNGAELLRLLQGNADKTHGLVSDTNSPSGLLGGITATGSQVQKSSQKGSALKIHGPIGPPRRSSYSPPKSPIGILGRLWAATPSSQSSQGTRHEASSRSSIQNHEDNDVQAALEILADETTLLSEANVNQEKTLETLFTSVPANSGNAFSFQGDADVGLGATASLKTCAPHVAGSLQHRWDSSNFVDGPSQPLERTEAFHLHRHGRTSSVSDKQLKEVQDCSSLNVTFSQGLSIMEPLRNALKDSEFEFLSENRREDSRGGGRRGTQSRGERKRSGSKGSSGQWVAVNERQKVRNVEADLYVHGLQVEEKHESRVSKLTNGVLSKADEDKRHKRQQQEWRLKQPQLGGSLQQKLLTKKLADTRNTLLEVKVFVNSERENHPGLVPLASQLEHPGLSSKCLQGSVPGPALQQGRQQSQGEMARYERDGGNNSSGLEEGDCETSDEILGKEEQEEFIKEFADYLELEDDKEFQDHSQNSSSLINQQTFKDPEISVSGNTSREPRRPKQRSFTMHAKKVIRRRADLENFTIQLLEIYKFLIPSAEEEMKRRKFFSQLDGVVNKKWPGAKLFLYGSCANAFGVRNSDIDVCLNVEDKQMSKAELVMRMAEILEADNMQNVQALTHARVPIVKFTDSVTGISCDICVNNMLAVVNTKLLRDYAKIDVRLRQLAFIVKHWAKCRQVNETYRGTLSSYAYVLMCIHFLQQRDPPILPCLQEMQPTYRVKVGKIECAYYDQVESISHFGSQNKDSLGELVTSFFEYWAFQHNYNHVVISVRTGGTFSKDEKDWTRRIGNERHLICIEDPFEISHDLGRVVDKHSIRVLRDEFYRAANIMRHDCNPAVTLFEPYIRDRS